MAMEVYVGPSMIGNSEERITIWLTATFALSRSRNSLIQYEWMDGWTYGMYKCICIPSPG